MSIDPLDKVRSAYLDLRTAQEKYEQAIRDADLAGVPHRLIADAAGMTRQAVWKLVRNYVSRKM